jgi:hypothetical protein
MSTHRRRYFGPSAPLQSRTPSLPAVDILVATYNAGPYLKPQVESLLNQDYPNIHLIIRDDNSTDGTRPALAEWQSAYAQRITLWSGPRHRLGVTANFSELLCTSRAPYVMFCDQDDVWLPFKVSRTLDEMRRLEEAIGAQVPILIHTDLTVVNEDLHILGASFVAHRGVMPDVTRLNRLLAANVATGCTMLLNRPLVTLVTPIPQQAVLHDHWVTLVAGTLGTLCFVPDPTILYRQHSRNVVGAPKRSNGALLSQALTLASSWTTAANWFQTQRSGLQRTEQQAQAFLDRYGERLPEHQRRLIKTYASLSSRGFLARRILLARHGYWRPGLTRRLGMMIYA